MKKILRKCCLVLMLLVLVVTERGYVIAADVNSKEEMEENISEKMDIELRENLEFYIQSDDISSVKELVISTNDGYKLTMQDLKCLKEKFSQLESLDVTRCQFDDESTFVAYKDYFEQSTVNWSYTEYAPSVEYEEGILKNAAYLEETEASYTLSLNGICTIDKGNRVDAGVAYESSDPNVNFRWKEYDLTEKKWSMISDWSQGNWTTWTPKKAGDYWLYVEARTSDGREESSVCGYHYQGIQVKLSGICVLNRDTYFDIGVAYESNDPGLTFRWKEYNLAEQKWSLIQDTSSSNWAFWSPKKKGDYWIHVEATDSNGDVTTYTMGFYFEGLKLSLKGICIIEENGWVNMGVAYDTNDAGVQFQWKLYDLKEKKWSQICNWNSGNWASWKPKNPGDYWLYVEGKTSDGQFQNQVMGYHVSGAEITEFKVSPESPNWVGSKIQLLGKYKDVIGEVDKSRYLVYDGNVWRELPKNENETAEWIPEALGNYLLCYEIYNQEGNVIQQAFKGFSIEKPYANLTGIYVRQDGDMLYSMAASCQTNDSQIKYRWMIYDVGAEQWQVVSGWSGSNATTWKPSKEGYYWIHVEARLSDGTESSYTMGYTVQRYPVDIRMMMLQANNYSSSTPYIILVNRSTHKVGVFNGWQGNWNLRQYWDCADGKPSTPTVTGVFKVGSRGTYFDSGNARCHWWTQFYGDYLFHSVLYNKDGTIQDGRVGMALSHGCVRLQIQNAKWIYDNIPSGTTVVVY